MGYVFHITPCITHITNTQMIQAKRFEYLNVTYRGSRRSCSRSWRGGSRGPDSNIQTFRFNLFSIYLLYALLPSHMSISTVYICICVYVYIYNSCTLDRFKLFSNPDSNSNYLVSKERAHSREGSRVLPPIHMNMSIGESIYVLYKCVYADSDLHSKSRCNLFKHLNLTWYPKKEHTAEKAPLYCFYHMPISIVSLYIYVCDYI
jgi:hypothetical protein